MLLILFYLAVIVIVFSNIREHIEKARRECSSCLRRCFRPDKNVHEELSMYARLDASPAEISLCQAEKLEHVFQLSYTQGQDIFVFLDELQRAVKQIHDENEMLPEMYRVSIPEAVVRTKLIQALKLCPMFKAVLDAILTNQQLTLDDVYSRLGQINLHPLEEKHLVDG